MLPRSAAAIRSYNPKVTTLSSLYPDFQSPNDADTFVIAEPHPVRPASEDAFTADLDDGTLKVEGGYETSRAPEANGVAVEDHVHLCDPCLSALGYLAYYLKDSTASDRTDESLINEKPAVVHHWNIIALNISSVSTGCHLCNTLFSRYFYPIIGTLGPERLVKTRLELTLNTTEMNSWNGEAPGDPRLICAQTLTNMERATDNYNCYFRLQLWPSPSFDHYFENREHQLGPIPKVFALPGEHATTLGTQSLAKQWLENCRRNIDGSHDACNVTGSGWLPNRLLDLSTYQKDGKIRMETSVSDRIASGQNGQYITLSHCWGEWGAKELPVLKHANLHERRNVGIDFKQLPQTFQDAVTIAGWFNVQWLWIDSLCIIQDSESDWEHEALLMCEVYKNALLNISADGSFDARDGCFHGRHPASVTPFKLHLRTMDSSWWVTPDERNLFDWVRLAPTSRRAWIFQERQLSKRILHFGMKELFWECCAPPPSFACETYPIGSPLKRSFLGRTKIEIPPQSANNMGDQPLLRQRWYETCSDFSKKQLTYPTDRLPALAGLAKEFSSRCPSDQYLAGLWSSTLPFSLLWTTDKRAVRDIRPPSMLENYPQEIAPSWSWMSVPFPITSIEEEEYRHSLVSIKDITYLTKHGDRFGKIENASMMMKGFLRQIRVVFEQAFDESSYPIPIGKGQVRTLFVDGEETQIGSHSDWSRDFEICLDSEADAEGGRYHCLFLAATQFRSDEVRALKGLLLEWSDSAGGFRRVGIASFQASCALHMRYRLKPEVNTDSQTAWHGLWNAVSESWGEARFGDPTTAAKQMPSDSDRPLSLYDYDSNADTSAFDRLNASWIKLV